MHENSFDDLPEQIITEENPIIRKKSSDVTFPLSVEDLDIIKKIKNYVDWSTENEKRKQFNLTRAYGMSAVQIGKPKKIIYINIKKPIVYRKILINPEIVKHSPQKAFLFGGEGCLSVRREVDVIGNIYRYQWVRYKAFDYELNQYIEETVEDLQAIVLQHELDHLKGILYIDYLENQMANEPGNNPKQIKVIDKKGI